MTFKFAGGASLFSLFKSNDTRLFCLSLLVVGLFRLCVVGISSIINFTGGGVLSLVVVDVNNGVDVVDVVDVVLGVESSIGCIQSGGASLYVFDILCNSFALSSKV